MRLKTVGALLLFVSSILYSQGRAPELQEQRLIAFADQLWTTWMKNGDIRSVASMRVMETLDDASCRMLVYAMDEKLCTQLTPQERADFLPTSENVGALISYRLLAYRELDPRSKAPTISDVLSKDELDIITALEGRPGDVTEFRGRMPQELGLERLLLTEQRKNFEKTRKVYTKNVATMEQRGFRNFPRVTRLNEDVAREYGLKSPGEYFAVREGLSIIWLRVKGPEMKFVWVQPVTR